MENRSTVSVDLITTAAGKITASRDTGGKLTVHMVGVEASDARTFQPAERQLGEEVLDGRRPDGTFPSTHISTQGYSHINLKVVSKDPSRPCKIGSKNLESMNGFFLDETDFEGGPTGPPFVGYLGNPGSNATGELSRCEKFLRCMCCCCFCLCGDFCS